MACSMWRQPETVVQKGLNPSLPQTVHGLGLNAWPSGFLISCTVRYWEEINIRDLAEAWVLWTAQWTSQISPLCKSSAQSSLSGQLRGSPSFPPFRLGHFSLLPTSNPPSSLPTARRAVHRPKSVVSREAEAWGFPLPRMIPKNS